MEEPISTQSVHKWLTGQSVPVDSKMQTLAKWLNVSTEWLRSGHEVNAHTLSGLERIMLNRFSHLSERQQLIIIELLDHFKNDLNEINHKV